jgi:hypothetical protein
LGVRNVFNNLETLRIQTERISEIIFQAYDGQYSTTWQQLKISPKKYGKKSGIIVGCFLLRENVKVSRKFRHYTE